MLMVPAFCQALKSQLKFGTGKMSVSFLIEKKCCLKETSVMVEKGKVLV